MNFMPAYEYKCETCEHIFEVNHSMNENPIMLCPECNASAKRLFPEGPGLL